MTTPSLRLVIGAALFATAASAQPAPGVRQALSPRNANYTIAARLEPGARTITGQETILWQNLTGRDATELQFHLYWNAWRDTKSTWMREATLGRGRNDLKRTADERGRIDVTAIRVGGADLASSMHFVQPDDGNVDDRTVLAVPLPVPVRAGGGVSIDVAWTAHVPRTFARTGAIGDFFFIAQWFPKLGVLQDAGWNCHQFHSSTEFFSDYGVYDVRLSVPRGWTVGATGTERDRAEGPDGLTTHHYYQEDVHDFAWTTSPDYLERRARFESPGLPAVDMRLLLQPEHAGQEQRHFDATRTALRYYGEWYGPYPYGHITIVDPAYQSRAGGMEYPTLFTAGSRWLAPERVTTPESVTVHEAGHQFWYGIVGNNEFEDAWMDEGFNQFSTARAVAQAYTPNHLAIRYFGGFVPWVFRDIVLSRETDANGLRGYRNAAKSDAPATPSYRYFPATGGTITYNKTALWLNTLERWLGWPVLQRAMSTHFERWKFRHPRPDDFFNAVSEATGRDVGWFFDQVYRSSNVFDYGVDRLESEADGGRYRTTVVVRRYGEAVFPVDVLVTFANGDRIVEHWDGSDRWKAYTYGRAERAVSAIVDPDRVLLLDVNYTNNSKTLEPKRTQAATKWAMTWMVWLQDALLDYGFFV